MSGVLLEIVPRDRESLVSEARLAAEHFPEITGINIPDLLRFDIRSWEAASMLRGVHSSVMPHLRAMDVDINDCGALVDSLVEANVSSALVIRGDPPADMSRKVFSTTSIKLIRKLKSSIPGMKVYAAVDQYRSGIKDEFDYIELKKDAGADGFMTQPFFDLRLIDIFAERMKGTDVYIGISPVTSEKSQSYWESRNRAYFPGSFRPTFEWNVSYGREVLSFCRGAGVNLYLMPIRIDTRAYLEGLFR